MNCMVSGSQAKSGIAVKTVLIRLGLFDGNFALIPLPIDRPKVLHGIDRYTINSPCEPSAQVS